MRGERDRVCGCVLERERERERGREGEREEESKKEVKADRQIMHENYLEKDFDGKFLFFLLFRQKVPILKFDFYRQVRLQTFQSAVKTQ